MRNTRVFGVLSLGLVLGLAACGGDATEEAVVEEQAEPVVIEDSVYVDPAVTEGAVVMDTSMAGTVSDIPVTPPTTADTARP